MEHSDPVERLEHAVESALRKLDAAEAVWPAECALLAAIGLYTILPSRLLLGPRPLVPGLELLLLVLIRLGHRRRRAGDHVSGWLFRHSLHQSLRERGPCLFLLGVLSLVNGGTVILLTAHLLHHSPENGRQLLLGALSIWATNVLIFALWYWENDRGAIDRLGRPRFQSDSAKDFKFPQEEGGKSFTPSFIDYLYLAFTNATAFSPTDAMPITAKAKMAMMLQSSISLLTVLLVTARAVNILV